jgi:UDPglucose--hexose-1-phosphate uridylyltransferase
VVPNKFPALQIEGDLNRQGDGMYDMMNGIGAHEVVIETPEHGQTLAGMSERGVEDVLWSFRDRILDLKKDQRFRYILVFKNHGEAAGASLEHPHSQLIATPIIPKRVQEELDGAKEYYNYKERCVFCDIIRQESNQGARMICENDDFIAIAPYAARFPFETWILPKTHDPFFEDAQKHEYVDLSKLLREPLLRQEKVLTNPPYNLMVHNSPLRESDGRHYHWHIEVLPKLTRVAGFEWGSGFYINPTPPEEAAKYLRDVVV